MQSEKCEASESCHPLCKAQKITTFCFNLVNGCNIFGIFQHWPKCALFAKTNHLYVFLDAEYLFSRGDIFFDKKISTKKYCALKNIVR